MTSMTLNGIQGMQCVILVCRHTRTTHQQTAGYTFLVVQEAEEGVEEGVEAWKRRKRNASSPYCCRCAGDTSCYTRNSCPCKADGELCDYCEPGSQCKNRKKPRKVRKELKRNFKQLKTKRTRTHDFRCS